MLASTQDRSSPAARASRRRAICIFPQPRPARDSVHSTLLPYCHSPSDSIAPAPLLARPLGPLPPPPPMSQDSSSSAGSTPQATYTETDSDVSSFYNDLDLDFPSPPGISPAIRRMQSSPLFTAEETDAVRVFLRRRCGVLEPADAPPPVTLIQASEQRPLSDFSWGAESPDCNDDSAEFNQLALAGEALLQAAMVPQIVPEVPPPYSRSSTPGRVLRRATSMAAPLSPALAYAAPPPLPPSRSLRFQDVSVPPSLVSAGREKPRHRTNLSMPVAPRGTDGLPALGPSYTHHRAARSLGQPIHTHLSAIATHDPRSFIDLSPDRTRRDRSSKVPLKRLLSRAKSGLIEWSKGLGLSGKKETR
ncbi:hypothetical protein MKEN_00655100 [Mycena kentingensis (nom. inval.)]|nr:hypothetical protein MKEN_00655100 [Mycena kentingensis (nom. inval.)]